mmetsp:Transcript_39193/g.92265  ORF Transcript_39193/g.92265 Transcript_39193/m.92265 type:complete len:702 (+) Transcript_39193:67-2172(+)
MAALLAGAERGEGLQSERQREKKMHALLKARHAQDEGLHRLAKLDKGLSLAEAQEIQARRRVANQEQELQKRRLRAEILDEKIYALQGALALEERRMRQMNPEEEIRSKSPLSLATSQPWSTGSLPTALASSTGSTTLSSQKKPLAEMPLPRAVAGVQLYSRGADEKIFDPEKVRAETEAIARSTSSMSAMPSYSTLPGLIPQEGSRAGMSAPCSKPGSAQPGRSHPGSKGLSATASVDENLADPYSMEDWGDSTTLPSQPYSRTQISFEGLQAGDSLYSNGSSWLGVGSPRLGILQRISTHQQVRSRAQTCETVGGRSLKLDLGDEDDIHGTLDEWFGRSKTNGTTASSGTRSPMTRGSSRWSRRGFRDAPPPPPTPQQLQQRLEEHGRRMRQQSERGKQLRGKAALRQALVDAAGDPIRAFDLLDINNNGSISVFEFESGLAHFCIDWKELTGLNAIRDVFKLFDHNRTGQINPGKLFPISFVPLSVKRQPTQRHRATTPQFVARWCDEPPMVGGRSPKWQLQDAEKELDALIRTVRNEDLLCEKRKQMKGMISRLKLRGKSDAQCREIVARHLPKGTGPKDRTDVQGFSAAEVEQCRRTYNDEVQDKVRSIEKAVSQLHTSRNELHSSKQLLNKVVLPGASKASEAKARKLLHAKSVSSLLRATTKQLNVEMNFADDDSDGEHEASEGHATKANSEQG